MSAPLKPWESTLQNNGQILKNVNIPPPPNAIRAAPVLPPRPQPMNFTGGMNGYGTGYSPYSSYSSYGNSYGYGGMGGMGGMQFRSPYLGGYNPLSSGYGMYGGTGYASGFGAHDAESRFVQFAEESSRNTFSNVESIIRAFSSMAMMLDSTFFAMTSSFRAVLGVAENFGRLRSMFGHIWHALNIFRLFRWMYRKLMMVAGYEVPSNTASLAWNEATNGLAAETAGSAGSNWSTIALLGVLFSAPYFISKMLPKYEDKADPAKWKHLGIPAKAIFDFAANSQNELSLHQNDEISLAPKSLQDEMKLANSGWAFATCNGRTGVVPLNHIVIMKRISQTPSILQDNSLVPIPRNKPPKRVTFGENQVFVPSENERLLMNTNKENININSSTPINYVEQVQGNNEATLELNTAQSHSNETVVPVDK